jgi:hypothetical protein
MQNKSSGRCNHYSETSETIPEPAMDVGQEKLPQR